MKGSDLRHRLRVVVITDRDLATPREVDAVVRASLQGGARAVQLRDKSAGAAELLRSARRLLALTRAHDALLFVNDRLDVALAAGADGVHLGPHDLPVDAVRRAAPADFLIGFSTDDPTLARAAETGGADYIGCGAVFGTTTKDVGAEAIGLQRLDEVAHSVGIPVVGIGGVTVDGAVAVAGTAAAGVAVVGAVMQAQDPAETTRRLVAPFLGGATGKPV